jgi:hypothetical protein
MKYITDAKIFGQDNQGLTYFFPSLLEFNNSNKVYLCSFRPNSNVMFFSHNKYDVLVAAMYGDYDKEILDSILALAKIRKGQHLVVPSTVNPPVDYVLPDNVHWIVTRSMYSIYTKNIKYISKDRPPVERHFISLNHRFMWFRQELFYYMYANNLLDFSYFAYEADDRFNEGRDILFKRATDIIGDKYSNVDLMCQQIPYKNFAEIDIPKKNTQIVDFRNVQNFYNRAAIAIESETFLEDYLDYNPGFAEKTMRPLILGNPFLVYNNRGTLATLREMGFETFSNIIDESYDTILNPQKRFETILNEVGRLSKENPAMLLNKVQDILEHNQTNAIVTLVEQAKKDNESIYNLIKSLL